MATHEVGPTPLARARLLKDILDPNGRYHAGKLARALDWKLEELARYLDRDPSTLSRYPSSVQHQDKLAALAATFEHLFAHCGGDLAMVRAWLRTPILVLDRQSPKDLILRGELARVNQLLDEYDSGVFAA